MLESLQDIEIASRLVGFDVDDNDSIDDKFKKLHCDISPLPHDSEDYRLIEKFLNTTHAPTHTVCLQLNRSNSQVLLSSVSLNLALSLLKCIAYPAVLSTGLES